jgi:hypothetical protein
MRGACALLLLTLALPAAAAETIPQIAGLLRDTRLDEISGLAVSARQSGRLWLHNDSGTRAELFAVDSSGRVQARLEIPGLKPVDWEDMAAFTLDGKPYLLIGDVGDNGARRQRSELIIVEEPDFRAGPAETELRAAIAWRVPFRYADEPHDVEAVGVDVPNRRVLLLTKRTDRPQVWSLPLRPADGQEQVAQRLGELAAPKETLPIVDFQRRLQPGRPTALAISADGYSALVLTYASAWLYRRAAGQDWVQAFAQPPRVFPIGLLAQAEAAGLDADGRHAWLSGERWPAPLLRLDLPNP